MRLADRCYICGAKECDGTCPSLAPAQASLPLTPDTEATLAVPADQERNEQ